MAKFPSEDLTPIADVAAVWEVSEKTIGNWVSLVYQAWEILLPVQGPFPKWGVALLAIVGKHVSTKAPYYTAETGEARRLKNADFVLKIHRMRKAGHFQEFDQYRQLQQSKHVNPSQAADELENQTFVGLSDVTQQIDREVNSAKDAVDRYADKKVDELVDYLDRTPARMLQTLNQRLQTRLSSPGSVQSAFTAFAIKPQTVEAEVIELPEILELPEVPSEIAE